MPVCYHKRQYLTVLTSEHDLSSLVAHLIVLKVFSKFPCSLFPLTSFIPSFSVASDLSLQFAHAYLSQYLGSIYNTCQFHMHF